MCKFKKNKNNKCYEPNPLITGKSKSVSLKKIVVKNHELEIGFEWGNKDPWVVYINNNSLHKRWWPRDEAYFLFLRKLAQDDMYGKNKIISDFISLYQKTTKNVDDTILNGYISNLANTYNQEDQDEVNYLLTILYLAMVSEFHYVTKNCKPSIYNKKVKLIGVYQVVIEEMDPNEAAEWSLSKNNAHNISEKYKLIKEDLNKYGLSID